MMQVLWDDWREYTEKEKRLIEELLLLRKPNRISSLIEDLRRSKGYTTQVQGGSLDMEVLLAESFKTRRLEIKVKDYKDYTEKMHLSLRANFSVSVEERGVIFERPVPDLCEIRLDHFSIGDDKDLTMFLSNYNPHTLRVEEWHSRSKFNLHGVEERGDAEPHYMIRNVKTLEAEFGKVKDLNLFANKLVRKAFEGFDLLLQGRAEEWLENWTGELKSLLQENVKQSRPSRRR